MKKELVFELSSAHREKQEVYAYTFGSGKKVLAVVGSMRGTELQQLFIASQLVRKLREIEHSGELKSGIEITVIPVVNSASMNIGKRYFTLDNTDINRMFPGYVEGETTQRIAGKVFEFVKGYQVGINLTSFYMSGDFAPHVRTLQTGYEDRELGKKFGLGHYYIRETRPQETATLNYNWQVFGTQAFSLYAGGTEVIDNATAHIAIDSVLRFMSEMEWIKQTPSLGRKSRVITERELVTVTSTHSGIFYKMATISSWVTKGTVLGEIIDPTLGEALSQILSPCDGEIFYTHSEALIFENKIAFIIVEKELL